MNRVSSPSPNKNPTRPRSTLMAGGLLLLSLLLTETLLAQDQSSNSEFQFFPCETRVKVTLIGLPEVAGFRLADWKETCGTGIELGFDRADQGYEEAELWNSNLERMPRMSVTEKRRLFDIRVIWNATETPITYSATRLSPTTPDTALTPDKPGGPPLRVSIEPAEDNTHIGINAVASNASRIIPDLERLKGLTFRNKSLLSDALVTFMLDDLDTRSLVQLLADASGIAVRTEGESTYVFGKPANADKINQLRIELAALPDSKNKNQRIKLLQDIIDLASTDKPDELPSNVDSEVEELTKFFIDSGEFARARKLILLQIEQIKFFLGEDSRAAQALALVDLGQVQRLENNLGGAKKTLDTALTMLGQYPNRWTLPARARALREQAYVALNSGSLADASIIIQRANAVLEDTLLPEWDQDEVYQARKSVEWMSGWIATKYLEKGDRAAAQIHIENALKLNEAIWGKQDPLTDDVRYLTGLNLTELGDKVRAAEFQKAQIAASMSRSEPLSATYVQTIVLLCTNLTEQEKFSAALEVWGKHVSLMRASVGESSSYYVDALKDLALLHRLSMEAQKAAEIERIVASIPVKVKDSQVESSLPEGLEFYLESRMLSSNLLTYYARESAAIGEAKEKDNPAMLRANWRFAEVMASEGHYGSAIIKLHNVDNAGRKLLPAGSEESRSYSNRLKELCAIYELEADSGKFPSYACPG